MAVLLFDELRANNPDEVRLVQDGRIIMGAYGSAAPSVGLEWDPTADLTNGDRVDFGYYSEDGFELSPEPGDNKQFKAHNEDVVIDEDGPGTWSVKFSALQNKIAVAEAYYDATVDRSSGSITVSKASVNTYRDLITVGFLGDDLVLTHFPRVKVADRDALTFSPGAINSFGMTLRAFKHADLGYQFKQWNALWLEAEPTITSATPTGAAATETVTITGTNLTGATIVKFGTSNATSFEIVSSTSITAVMPTGSAGSAQITVTTPNGTATSPYTRA